MGKMHYSSNGIEGYWLRKRERNEEENEGGKEERNGGNQGGKDFT